MNVSQAFQLFCNNLMKRQTLTTEDNVRYYWLQAMLQQDASLNNYTLEYPYVGHNLLCTNIHLQGKELDLLYEGKDANGKDVCFCFEIKFHHCNNKSTLAHTDMAGSLINDLLRLENISSYKQGSSVRRFLLYVSDDEMDRYLKNKYNKSDVYRANLKQFYVGNANTRQPSIVFPNRRPQTFYASATKSLSLSGPLRVPPIVLLDTKDCHTNSPSFKNGGCHVRLYEVI